MVYEFNALLLWSATSTRGGNAAVARARHEQQKAQREAHNDRRRTACVGRGHHGVERPIRSLRIGHLLVPKC